MASLRTIIYPAIIVFAAGAMGFLAFSPCASNDTIIVNGTGQSIDVVLRIGKAIVWTGEIKPSDKRDASFMHPGGEGAIDIQVTVSGTQRDFREKYGYVVPFDGDRQIFLVDHKGIHYAPISPQSSWDRAMVILEMIFRPMAAKVACAGPDWL